MATALVFTSTTVATINKPLQAIEEYLVPDLPRLNRLNREDLIRLHLLHPLRKLHSLFLGIEHHPVVQPACSNLVALPHRLGHRLSSKQSIEFQVLQPKRICVLIFSSTSVHRYTPFW
jgi:hypothetical protein